MTLLVTAGCGLLICTQSGQTDFRFAILGDRTGGAQPGVYEEVWRETALDHPDFVISVGDTIEGGNDVALDAEWQNVMRRLRPYRRFPMFFTPGNHDVWSPASALAYEKYTRRSIHYSFNFGDVHFVVLNNSETDSLPEKELNWLEMDLQSAGNEKLKFVFSHRPSWLLNAVLLNSDFRLQRLAKKYSVQNVIAGHIHQMLRFELDGVTYLSMASSGGHLRNSKQYEDGWFFQHTMVNVHGDVASFEIKEAEQPIGKGRITHLSDWGASGLVTAARKTAAISHDRDL